MRAQVEHLAVEIGRGNAYGDPGRPTLVNTRRTIVGGWQAGAKRSVWMQKWTAATQRKAA